MLGSILVFRLQRQSNVISKQSQQLSPRKNFAIARALLEGIGGGKDPADNAALFDERLLFEIRSDHGVMPWIERKTGRSAIADFIRDTRATTEPVSFEAKDQGRSVEDRRRRLVSDSHVERYLARAMRPVSISLSVRQQLAAHVRARAVGADEYVSLCSRAILKALNYPAVRRCLEGSEGFAKDDDASSSGVSPRL
jgi:hypothetical protein